MEIGSFLFNFVTSSRHLKKQPQKSQHSWFYSLFTLIHYRVRLQLGTNEDAFVYALSHSKWNCLTNLTWNSNLLLSKVHASNCYLMSLITAIEKLLHWLLRSNFLIKMCVWMAFFCYQWMRHTEETFFFYITNTVEQ